jgi:NitT/TauT family transport system substrate-binding protein
LDKLTSGWRQLTGRTSRRRLLRCAACLVLPLVLLTSGTAKAETSNVRIAGVYGLINLPVYVALEKHMIEEQARLAGLPAIKVTPTIVSGGANAADLLLSGNVDVAAASITNLLVLWDRTHEMGPRQVRGMSALADSPVFLITADPRIKSLGDYTPNDRIAVTNIKSSIQAITLDMAAAKAFGWDQRFRLEPLTVAMPHEDGMAALLTGATEVKSQAAQLPFAQEELESGKTRLLLTTTDVLGGPANISVAMTTAKFRNDNPKAYGAVAAALREATTFIENNKQEAAEIYVKNEPQKKGVNWILNILQKPELVAFTFTPHGNQQLADFMFQTGLLHSRPASWQELYWDPASMGQGN